jgi:hypothetical protein
MEINKDTLKNTRCYKLAGLANNLFVILPLFRLTYYKEKHSNAKDDQM